MSLDDTSKAIGAVTEALKERLIERTIPDISVGRIDQSKGAGKHLNLFLYEIVFDPHLKNTPLNEGEKPPVWLVLKYLLTAFEETMDSDSSEAHKTLGLAIRAMYQDDLLKLDGLPPNIKKPLESNPSELHVTFDEAPSELVAKVTQGTDETPRLSIAFQVRPVMIASGEPGNYSLLVGVDYTSPPTLSPKPIGLDIIPSMGSFISEISPTGFEVNEVVSIRGTDLHLASLSVLLGGVELPVTMQQPDELRFKVDHVLVRASGISAGSHPVTVVQTHPGTGKKRKSNTVIGNLVPTLDIARVIVTPHSSDPEKWYATINLEGMMLGTDEDDTILALYRDGSVYKMFDVFASPSPPPPPGPLRPQPTRKLVMVEGDAVPTGDYNIILLVNGQQAPQSPIVPMHNP